MDGTDKRELLLEALTAEHVVMQNSIGSGVNEQQARASMYLLSASGSVVAIGLLSRSEHFLLFTAAILPMLFLAGVPTILRLVDICMEGLQCQVTIARIHGYYRTLGKDAGESGVPVSQDGLGSG